MTSIVASKDRRAISRCFRLTVNVRSVRIGRGMISGVIESIALGESSSHSSAYKTDAFLASKAKGFILVGGFIVFYLVRRFMGGRRNGV